MTTSTDISTNKEEAFSLLKIVASLFCIIAIRMFLDKLAYQDASDYFLSQERIIHASLYYFSIFLSLAILTYFLTKTSIRNILDILTKIMLFILLVPIVDLVFKMGQTKPLFYLVIKTNDFFLTFFKIMNPFSGQGITFGQHIGAYAIFITLAIFIYKKTRSIFKALLSIILGYAILFFDAILPSIFSALGNKNSVPDQATFDVYASILKNSWVTNAVETTSNYLGNLLFSSNLLNVYHEILLARFFWILVVVEIAVIFFIANRQIWNVLKNNLRLERIIYWFIIATIGIVLSQKMFGNISLRNPANFITLLVFFMLIILNIWLAVFINDAEDVDIDKISNPDRPLVKKEISEQEWNVIQIILLILIVLGLFTLNNATAFLLVFAQATYYIYSARPLRLKRHFLFSSMLIGLATVFIAMAGFFLVSPYQSFFIFPIKAMFILGISYALISNLKDIKDFEGDSCENMRTIPVVFGLKNAKYIIATLCAAVVIAIPLILKAYSVSFFSICIALLLFYLFNKEKYQEKYIFLTIFIYLAVLFFATI
jgi:4-hydroxybenzoate polyprenyltransferase